MTDFIMYLQNSAVLNLWWCRKNVPSRLILNSINRLGTFFLYHYKFKTSGFCKYIIKFLIITKCSIHLWPPGTIYFGKIRNVIYSWMWRYLFIYLTKCRLLMCCPCKEKEKESTTKYIFFILFFWKFNFVCSSSLQRRWFEIFCNYGRITTAKKKHPR